MTSFRFVFALLFVAGCLAAASTAEAQVYGGGGFFGGGFGFYQNGYGNFGGSNMSSFAPPHSIGGYYPTPYSTIFPGYVGNGFNASPWGAGPMSAGPYGNGGYGYGGAYRADGYDAYGRPPVYVPGGNSSVTTLRPAAPATTSVYSGSPIKLICPKVATGTLNYSLNGAAFTIQPGFSQSFREDRNWKLEFRRGGDGSELVTYTLKSGTYNFAVGPAGWELRQVVPVSTNPLPPAPEPAPLPSSTPGPAT